MTGITASSASFSAVSCEASLVKTSNGVSAQPEATDDASLTKTWCKQLGIEVCEELLALCIELAHSCDDIARQTDADDLHDGLEDE